MSEEQKADLEAQLADVERRLAHARGVYAAIVEDHPDAITLVEPDGTVTVNPAAAEITKGASEPASDTEWAEAYGFFREDQTTRLQQAELPLVRAMKGELPDDELLWMVAPGAEGRWLRVTARGTESGGGIAVFRDVTGEVALDEDLRARATDLARSDEENRELIERLRVSLDELSTPVLELWHDVLVLPVIGLVDTQRSAQMTQRAIAEITQQRASFLVLDLTGVEVLDTSTADRFMRLACAVRLLGADCIVSGIQPAVARTLIEIGVELEGLETTRNLRKALALCRRRLAARSAQTPTDPR